MENRLRTFYILSTSAMIAGLCFIFLLSRYLDPFGASAVARPPRYMKNSHTRQKILMLGDRYYNSYTFSLSPSGRASVRNITLQWDSAAAETDALVDRFDFNDPLFHIPIELRPRYYLLEWDYSDIVELYSAYGGGIWSGLRNVMLEQEDEITWETPLLYALRFCQDIPYGVPPSHYKDNKINGLNVPPLMLTLGWGDCDSKAVLFSSLLRDDPNYEFVIISVPNHVLVGVKGIPKPYQDYVEYGGDKYIALEPVGPNHGDIGDAMSLRSVRRIAPLDEASFNAEPLPDEFFSSSRFYLEQADNPDELFNSGVEAYQKAGYQESVDLLVRSYLAGNENPRLYYYLAKGSMELGLSGAEEMQVSAIEALEKLSEKNIADYELLAEIAGDKGDTEKLMETYEEMVRLDSSRLVEAFLLGEFYYEKELFRKAHSYLLMVYQTDPDYPGIKEYLGNSMISLNRTADAIDLLEEAFLENPQSSTIAASLGNHFFSDYDLEKARFYLEQAHVNGYVDLVTVHRLAKLYLLNDEAEKSRALLSEVDSEILTEMDRVNQFYWSGIVEKRLGNPEYRSLCETAGITAKKIFDEDSSKVIAYFYYGLAMAEYSDDPKYCSDFLISRARGNSTLRDYFMLPLARLNHAAGEEQADMYYRNASAYFIKKKNRFMVEVSEMFYRWYLE